MTTDEVIGLNVHETIWRKRIGHRALYEAMGLSRSSLSKKLRGEVTWSAADIAAAARVLGVEPGELFALPPQVTRGYPARPILRLVA